MAKSDLPRDTVACPVPLSRLLAYCRTHGDRQVDEEESAATTATAGHAPGLREGCKWGHDYAGGPGPGRGARRIRRSGADARAVAIRSRYRFAGQGDRTVPH